MGLLGYGGINMQQFPFSAVAGLENFKKALILAAINPAIGGVLISGPRGCAKSTLARGLAQLLPEQTHDFVTLPLGASEEMLVGTLDLQSVLNEQQVKVKSGLLAKAHGGVLYVDEVNLLADSLVDLLLDVAASGINHIERDGISHKHVAEFLLLGTMNPDEGELREQLKDRFGLMVELDNQFTIEDRMEIVARREAFDINSDDFCHEYQSQQQQLITRIHSARESLNNINCSIDIRRQIAQRCSDANVDGLRADLVWYRAALAHAAWNENKNITEDDLDSVCDLVLAHRRKADSGSSPPGNSSGNSPTNSSNSATDSKPHHESPFTRPSSPSLDSSNEKEGSWGSMAPQTQTTKASRISNLTHISIHTEPNKSLLSGVGKQNGKTIGGRHASQNKSTSANWFHTLVRNAGSWPPKSLSYKKAQTGQAVLHFVMLDTSASTLAHNSFAQAKGLVLNISQQAYLKREQVCILGFGNDQVQELLPKVRAPKRITEFLDTITAAGGTPFRNALIQAEQYLKKLKRQIPNLFVRSYILTDGRSNQSVANISLGKNAVLIDMEKSDVKRGRAQIMAQQLGAQYIVMPDTA